MHKSKYFDKAGEMAISKLMPKPDISISISMAGGGGLSSISEPIINRVSGGEMIGEDFFGGYTDEYAGVSDDDLQDDPTQAPTPNRPEDLQTSKPGSSIRHGTRGWTKEGVKRGVSNLIDSYGDNVVLPLARFLGFYPEPKQADMLRTEPGRDQKTLTSLDLGEGKRSYTPGYGGREERIDIIREQGIQPEQAIKIQDASREREKAIRESERQKNIPETYRHSFRTSNPYGIVGDILGLSKALPLSEQPRSIRNLPIGFAQGGGLSNLNKTMMIKGQPHRLSYIDPRQAAIGGPVIKRQEGGDWYGESTADMYFTEDDFTPYADIPGSEFTDTEDATLSESFISSGGRGADPREFYDDQIRESLEAGEDPRTTTRDQNLMERAVGFFTGTPSDEEVTEKQSDLMNKAYEVGYGTWRNTIGKYSTDTPKDYDAWFAAQDPNALIAGYQIGDPVGAAIESSFNLVRQQLQNKFKTAKDERDYYGEATPDIDKEPSEMTREELQDAAKDIEGLEDFIPYDGIDYPWYMPGGNIVQGLNFLSKNVIGTGTINGVPIHVNKDGSVNPISPEDEAGFDRSGLEGENQSIERRKRKRKRVAPKEEEKVTEKIEETESFPTGRRIASLGGLQDIYQNIYGRQFRTG